jgi:hypothetical protein
MKDSMKDRDRHGEAAMAEKMSIGCKPTKLAMPALPKINAKEMRGDCYTADGRIKGDK